jgi:diaminopropionate ammonia-lyase
VTRALYLDRAAAAELAPSGAEPRALHRALPGYAPTPLVALPELAAAIGAGRVDVKLETDRFGLPSFKIMGASWATVTALRPLLPTGWTPEQGLAPLAGRLGDVTLVAATDGNHGRALARVATLLEVGSRIFVPRDLSEERTDAIAAEGGEVVRVDGTYDDAVARSAEEGARPGRVLVSDTSWPGYEQVPSAVIDGYGTILAEVEEQLSAPPDLVLVQLGVGAFGAAVIRHFRTRSGPATRIVGVEPTRAACVMASLAAGRILSIPGAQDSVMAGLNCGTPSLVAWPLLRDGLDAVVALDDAAALDGVRTLARGGLEVGECSGVVVAAAAELLAGPDADAHRARLQLPEEPSVLLFATEGVTDAAAFAAAAGAARVGGQGRIDD